MSNKTRYLELDVLRGFAALLVVFFHYTMGKDQAHLGFKLGTTGVDLFFMISGFVIYMSLLHIDKNYKFIINRAARLYPTYWASVTFTFIVILLASGSMNTDLIVDYLVNLTMFQHYFGIPHLDEPYWTLILEMTFYIAIYLLFVSKKWKYIDYFACGILIAMGFSDYLFPKAEGYLLILKYLPFLEFAALFYAGILFYRMKNGQNNLKHYVLLSICLFVQISFYLTAGVSAAFISQFQYGIMLSAYFLLFILFVNDKLKWIVNKPLLFFGKISYALYLIHQHLSLNVIIPYLENEMHLGFWVSRFIALVACVLIAYLITRFVEVPLRRKMKSRLYAKFA